VRRLLPLLIIVCGVQWVCAHPHVFIDPKITIVMKGKRLKYIDMVWLFDAMTSEKILSAFDKNNNRKLDRSELTHIRKKVFPGLSAYNYYTFITIDGTVFKPVKPTGFHSVFTGNKRIIYNFRIPVDETVRSRLDIRLEDRTIFTAFDYARKDFIVKMRPRLPHTGRMIKQDQYIPVFRMEFK
jgi:ABC-type uncharacterized transport system substrate-binding protein